MELFNLAANVRKIDFFLSLYFNYYKKNMRKLYLMGVIWVLLCSSLRGQTLENRIAPPAGYEREYCSSGSFAAYFRKLPLLPEGSKVLLYNGKEKRNQAAAFAVIDMEIGKSDLQQCADAVIRLRAEYLWSQKRYGEIKFNFTSGFQADYKKWAEGNRIKVSGNKVTWYAAGSTDYSYKTFRNYLNLVFTYAGTASLSKELISVPYTSLISGDVFIKGGFPGHAVIVVDVAVNSKTGEKVFLLAQSYMPAQQIHILMNPDNRHLSPWYKVSTSDEGKLATPEWIFDEMDLKRFK